MGYSLIILQEPERKQWSEAIQNEISAQLRSAEIPIESLKFTADPAELLKKNESAVGVYLAASDLEKGAIWSQSRSDLEPNLANIRILPVVSEFPNFSSQIPPELRRFNAMEYPENGTPDAIASHLLRMLGLTENERKVFISYRRADSSDVADQLWERLSRQGFDVFLDRVDIEPGINFQERVEERISDMSFVLLLETPGVKDSKWVQRELALTRELNLGLLLLSWPNMTYEFTTQGVYNVSRFKLTSGDFSPLKKTLNERCLKTRHPKN